ncbi:MAG: WD40 repeat domain-containing protein, partial [Roseimicrobium sp.]
PDGKTLVAGGADSRIRVWSVTSSALEGSNKILATRFAHEGTILNLTFNADGKTLVSTASDRAVKLWDVATLTEKQLLDKQPDWSPALAVLDGNWLAVGRLDGSLALYNANTGEALDKPKPTAAMPAAKAKAKPAAPVKPEITRAEPRGVQSGAITTVKLTGKGLKEVTAVKFVNPMLKATVKPLDEMGTAVELAITVDAKVPRSQQEFSVVTAAGESAKAKLSVDYLPQVVIGKRLETTRLELPVNVWGTLTDVGQQDNFRFAAKQGETVIFDLAAKRIDSKAVSPRLEVFDATGKLLASNNGLDSGSDPFLAFTAPREGEFTVRVREITLEGSPDHAYRLTAGVLPYVTGWWPLSLPANAEGKVHLVGHNLKMAETTVKIGTAGDVPLPLDTDDYRSRVTMKVTASTMSESIEREPNDSPATAQPLSLPASVNGRLYVDENADASDADLYALDLTKGQQVVLETRAAMSGSPADTKIEVLDAQGIPVPMMKMQATKDSSITLRSEDANDPAIRLYQFAEMDLNDYMYFNGEVLKIFRLARGPDADMIYYANGGKRRAFFNTSPAGHGLDEACYVVEPKRLDERIVPNGLPVFTLPFANDDDGERILGSDSRLLFTAPDQARYLVRVSDTRGWSGPRFAYRLIARAPEPDFSTQLFAKSVKSIPANSGVEFSVKVTRNDGWDGEVRVDITDVPPGFFVSTPIVVQAGHLIAAGSIFAFAHTTPGAHDFSKVKLTATATVQGKEVKKPLSGFANVTVTAPGKKSLFMEPDLAGKAAGDGKSAPPKP